MPNTQNPNFNGARKNNQKQGDLVNERIHYKEVLVIDPEGNQLGKLTRSEALRKAEEYGKDLLCVAPNANPPVCKILDYGKYRFEAQKKAKEAKRNQKQVEIKEIQLSPQIAEHDLLTRVKRAKEFFSNGNKVKVVLRFKGRQLAHVDIGEAVIKKFIEYVADECNIEKAPSLDGRQMTCVLASKTKKGG